MLCPELASMFQALLNRLISFVRSHPAEMIRLLHVWSRHDFNYGYKGQCAWSHDGRGRPDRPRIVARIGEYDSAEVFASDDSTSALIKTRPLHDFVQTFEHHTDRLCTTISGILNLSRNGLLDKLRRI